MEPRRSRFKFISARGVGRGSRTATERERERVSRLYSSSQFKKQKSTEKESQVVPLNRSNKYRFCDLPLTFGPERSDDEERPRDRATSKSGGPTAGPLHDMKWLLVFASVTACVSARPSQRPSGREPREPREPRGPLDAGLAGLTGLTWPFLFRRDVEAPRPPGQNMSRSASCDDNVNRTPADSARSLESRSSRSRSLQTANRSSESTPGDAWKPTSSAPPATLDLTSEDGAAFPGLSSQESDPAAAGVGFSSKRCLLATCSIADLGSKLQAGEETAGASARDSGGFGKK